MLFRSTNSHRLLSISGASPQTFSFDAAGHLSSDGQHSFMLDARNRVVGAANVDEDAVTYQVNGLGQRVGKSSTPGSTPGSTPNNQYNVYDEAGRMLGEYDASNLQETVYLGDLPMLLLMPGAVHYIDADQLGTPRQINHASGQALWSWESDAFGAQTPDEDPGNTGQALRYSQRMPGQQYDTETGQHYNWNRYYSPTTGRYLQSDPIGLAGGINTFAYALGNPLTYTDPNGFAPLPKWWMDGWAPKTSLGNCGTAECAAGLLPAPSENRTQSQIDVGQCKIVCQISLIPAVAACNVASGGGLPGAALGQVSKAGICSLVCGK